jgi:hypothetical protein
MLLRAFLFHILLLDCYSDKQLQKIVYFATFTALVSRITVTFTCPG